MTQSPPDTKDRILDVAERQFAEHGFAGTSLRSLTDEAGVNLAAVNYHFGSKQALLRAVVERRVGPLTEQRLKILEGLRARADGAPLAIEDVVDAFLRPVLASAETGRMREVSALIFREPIETMAPVVLEVFGDTVEEFLAELAGSLPHLDERELAERLQFVIGATVQIASGHLDFFLRARGLEVRTPEELLAAAKLFLAAGLRAPATRAERGES